MPENETRYKEQLKQAKMFQLNGDTYKAIQIYKDLWENSNKNTKLLSEYISCLKDAKQYEEAIVVYQAHWENGNKSNGIASGYATVLRQAGIYNVAREICQYAISTFGYSEIIRRQLLWIDCFEKVKDAKEPRSAVTNAIEIINLTSPTDPSDQMLVKYIESKIAEKISLAGIVIGQTNIQRDTKVEENNHDYVLLEDDIPIMQQFEHANISWDLIEDWGDFLLKYLGKHSMTFVSLYCDSIERIIWDFEINSQLQWIEKIRRFNFDNFPIAKRKHRLITLKVLLQGGNYVSYLRKILTDLNYRQEIAEQILNFIQEKVENYSPGWSDDFIERYRVSKLHRYLNLLTKEQDIKIFKREIPEKLTSSSIADYAFCPVNFCIKQSIKIPLSPGNEGQTKVQRRFLIDYYQRFKKDNNLTKAFENFDFYGLDKEKEFFDKIFSYKLVSYNQSQFTNYYDGDNANSNPDLVLENFAGDKIVFDERFTNHNHGLFINDAVKVVSYINELGAKFGYVIYWHGYYDHDFSSGEVINQYILNSIGIFRVTKSGDIEKIHDKCLNHITSLRNGDEQDLNLEHVTHIEKCLGCSVFPYCQHKKGFLDTLQINYEKYHK